MTQVCHLPGGASSQVVKWLAISPPGLWDRAVAWEHGNLPWSVAWRCWYFGLGVYGPSWSALGKFAISQLEVVLSTLGSRFLFSEIEVLFATVSNCSRWLLIWLSSCSCRFVETLVPGQLDKLETHLVTTCAHGKCEATLIQWSIRGLVDSGLLSFRFYFTPGMT